jgi:SPASM domain peptide maturase of grasp-with-spasm system
MKTYSKNTHFKIYATCQIVEGNPHNMLYDIERMNFYELSDSYLQLLSMSKKMDVAKIKRVFGNAQDELIDSIFNQFIGLDLGFYTTEPEEYPDIDLRWESPYMVTNAIIEINDLNSYNFKSVVTQLSDLGCFAVQLRALNFYSKKEWQHLIKAFKDTRINELSVLIPHSNNMLLKDYYKLLESEARLLRLMIYNAEEERIEKHSNKLLNDRIVFFKKDIRKDHSEIIKEERFTPTIGLFTEAQQHNAGLNRKVCIDKDGEIKNYLNHVRSFGNVNKTRIEKVIHAKHFQKKWFIPNDRIEVCKTCVYRYACVSNSDIVLKNKRYHKLEACSLHSSTPSTL